MQAAPALRPVWTLWQAATLALGLSSRLTLEVAGSLHRRGRRGLALHQVP